MKYLKVLKFGYWLAWECTVIFTILFLIMLFYTEIRDSYFIFFGWASIYTLIFTHLYDEKIKLLNKGEKDV